MDRELPTSVLRKKRVTRIIVAVAALLVLIGGFLGLRALLRQTLERARLLTSIAEVGTIEATVSASGVVVPEYEQILTAPVTSTIGSLHIRSGDSVHAGQSILQLNTEQLRLTFQKVSDEFEIQKSKAQQVILRLDRERSDLRAAHDIKVLSHQFTASKYDRAKHLFDIGGLIRADLDLAALELEIAKRESEQLADQVTSQDATLEAAKQELDLQLNVYANERAEIQRQLTLAEARAGRDGIVTWLNDAIGAPVNAGEVIARVGDLSSFEVEATISDVHVGKLKLGGPVNVRIRDIALRGKIAAISPAVQNGVVSFVVALDEKSDESLHPNLRADVFVVTSIVENVIRVKNGPFYNGNVDQGIFTIRGDHAVKTIVDIGVSNFDWVEIKSGIKPGDEVIVSDTKKYVHMDEVGIR